MQLQGVLNYTYIFQGYKTMNVETIYITNAIVLSRKKISKYKTMSLHTLKYGLFGIDVVTENTL